MVDGTATCLETNMIINLPLKVFFASAAVLCVGLTLAAAPSQSQTDSTVTVSVINITTHTGFIMLALYDEAGWGDEPVDTARKPVHGDTITLTMTAPKSGQYGIRLFHDIDGNGELNANVMGIPIEPFGFSNNAPPRFGPPSFGAAAFDIGEDGTVQTISLQ